jgi:hypothetical protein
MRERWAPLLGRLWPWVPVAFGVVYFALLLTTLRSVVQAIFWNADATSALTIGEAYPELPPHTEVVLGNFPWYSTLWFESATRGLPAHRDLWQVAPWFVSLAGVAGLAWSTGKAAGRWAAAMAALALVCASPPSLLVQQFAWSIHAWTYFHVCVLGVFLVLWADRGGRVGSWPVHVALAALLTVVTAIGLASDPLLAPTGLIPFAVAAAALAALLRRPARLRIAISAAAVIVGTLVGASLITHHMEANGVHGYPLGLNFAGWDQIGPNVWVAAQCMTHLFSGDFGGAKVDARSLLAFACGVTVLTAVYVTARYLRDWSRSVAVAARRRSRDEVASHPARTAHIVFWGLAGATTIAAFVLSSLPVGRSSTRYVVTGGYALAALVPVAAATWGRWSRVALVVGLCVVLTGSIASLVRRDLQDVGPTTITPRETHALTSLAHDAGVKYGYAPYWEAAPLTWQAKGAVDVYPVRACGDRPCPFHLHRINSWYDPRPGTKSLLISDSSKPLGEIPEARLGRPELVRQIGTMTVYVYGYDVATRFQQP